MEAVVTNIFYEYRAYKKKIHTHAHDYGQMIIPIAGDLNIATESQESVIDQDKLFFLPPEAEHAYAASSYNEFLVLDIPKEILIPEDMLKHAGGTIITLDEKWALIKHLIMVECQRNANPMSINNLFRYFYQDLVGERLSPSVAYIHAHFHEALSLEILARLEGYTSNYYSEWFKKNMHMTPFDYIKGLRIEKAKELLLNTSYSLMQIAQLVGYAHHASLTRVFKEHEGVTPMAFKKLNSKMVK